MGKTRSATLRLGGGSAFFNDRLDAALELVERGGIDVLILETLAERTLALLHVAKNAGGPGYWPRLRDRLEILLPACARHGVRLVSNGGGADPLGAARMALEIVTAAGLNLKVAAVTGDDVAGLVRSRDPVLTETGAPLSALGMPALASNAYLGADAIAAAYAAGADVILTGRVTDSALALGPLLAHHGWAAEDLDRLAAGVMTGHLLECGGQATGGYFAEPGLKDVPDLDRLGFPIAEVDASGTITLSKPEGSGGRVDRHTITEQLLYEVHDPSAYLTPDVVLDLSEVEIEEIGQDVVRLTGARGRQPPDTLKTLIGVDSGVLVEAEISYGGINAEARLRLAAETVRRRIARLPGLGNAPIRFDAIGIDSLWSLPGEGRYEDLRLRVAARVATTRQAEAIVTEVESLYVNGPAGGGGVRFATRPTIRTYTAFLPRAQVRPIWSFVA
ncbi:acyclic terpene utilization AtuA family protein [Bosea sp. (in: a-proteobacteria)]|uniref:acyclic terpene utilization AtuA family protein n=1 Tax=Bosea sp. (in: a-proteobacteria) TaxID=1871050 RepID=UPI00262CB09B|nr:acyclic terpene utilization AtuA family protein [Bosea sp. (in: a-proteobacteria)]MCO5089809.1 DUF1446 domain-containing protein [Bosea sp. (in: a-proteobacteria)]